VTRSKKISIKLATLLSLLIPLAVLIISQYRLRYFTWDDSYITYRHALNMVRGFGPVYNPGELADGITNYLLAWILAIGMKMHLEPIAFSKWLGVLSSWGVMIFTWFYGYRRMGLSAIFTGCALLLLATNGMFAVESVGGLETSFFTLLIFWIMWETTSANGKAISSSRLGIAGVASGIAMLTRPDTILFIFAAILLLIDKRNLKTSARRITYYLLPILIIFLPYFIKHWITFGYPFPNSYYAKKVATSNLLVRGFSRLITNITDIGHIILIIPICFAWLKFTKRQISNQNHRYILNGLLLFILARLIFIVISGGSWMGWGRFLVPVLPQIYLLAVKGIDNIPAIIPGEKYYKYVGAAVCVMLILSFNLWSAGKNLFHEETPSLHLDRIHIPLGLAIKDILKPGESISFGDAGALPYYADVINIDPAGLCDRHIAHLKGEFDVKTDPDYILNRHPTIIILNSINPYPKFNPQSPIDKAIVLFPQFRKEYEFVIAFEAWEGYNLWLFAPKEEVSRLRQAIISHPQLMHLFITK